MSNEETRTLRSDFLVHWTGKDIEKKYQALKGNCCEEYISAACCEDYVKRLRDTLIGKDNKTENMGLWMTKVDEELYLEHVPFGYSWNMTCFTETRLSLAAKHVKSYGRLGFGFRRSFVMNLHGIPVHYVTGTHDDVAKHFNRQIQSLKRLSENINEIKKCLTKCNVSNILEDFSVMNHIIGKLPDSIANNLLYIKNMSECLNPHDFKYFDENEWRVLYEGRDQKGVTPPNKNCDKVPKIQFTSDDLKIIIFPDDNTRQKALLDNQIYEWFERKIPIMATVEECSYL